MADGKKRILLVEDETDLRELYHDILQEEGFIVDEAKTGHEALEKMTKGGYDLVLLDILLPNGLDGIDVLKKLQEKPPVKPNGPVLILSNLDKESVIAEGVSLGIRGYLLKSDFDPGQIVKEVKNTLASP